MQNMMMGPFWGVLAILIVGGVITLGCFGLMFWLIFRPGEQDRHHVKYEILRPDR
ncbi:MAG: hypothetical protein ACREPL_06040 [Rhodanobacteraceae bacterium]